MQDQKMQDQMKRVENVIEFVTLNAYKAYFSHSSYCAFRIVHCHAHVRGRVVDRLHWGD